ncbi:MAG: transporter of the drug/metabolite transporter superfamily [Myxococcaceae bacterium]|nr:transporter of the drug/metabolite transporter superfamily [Myxococcaceae bacterium]
MHPVVMACARTGIAGVILALVAPSVLASSLRALSSKQRAAVALAGTLLAAHFALFLGGLATTSLAAAVALVSLEPLAVVLAALVAFGERPTKRELVGLLIATLGAVVVASAAGAGEHRLLGDVLVLGCVVLYGAYVAAARGLKQTMPALPYAAAVYGTASVVLLPIAIALGVRGEGGGSGPGATAVAAVVAMAIVPTLLGHTLLQRVARTAPAALVGLVSSGETVGSLAIGVIAMGTRPTVREGAGAVIVVMGAIVAVMGRRGGSGSASGSGSGREGEGGSGSGKAGGERQRARGRWLGDSMGGLTQDARDRRAAGTVRASCRRSGAPGVGDAGTPRCGAARGDVRAR